MLWGYAGIYRGETGVHEGDDVLMNKLRFVADWGFRSTGIRLSELHDPQRREQIGSFVAEHDMQLSVHFGAKYFEDDLDALRRGIDQFIAELGEYGDVVRAPIVTGGVGPYHRFMREPSLEQQMDRLAQVLPPLAKACHEMGRPFGLENHGDYYCEDLVGLCERVPHLGIFLDTGNTYLVGEQSVRACRAAAPYTIGTHFKDHHVYPDPKTLTFVIEGAVLGEGDVGLEQVYRDLMELAPAPQKLVMQWELVPPKDMNQLEAMEKSWAFIERLDPTVRRTKGKA